MQRIGGRPRFKDSNLLRLIKERIRRVFKKVILKVIGVEATF